MILRDNASNGNKACELFNVRDFGCIGHGFHLITAPFLLKKRRKDNSDDDGENDEGGYGGELIDDDIADYTCEDIEDVANTFIPSVKQVVDETTSIVTSVRTIAKYVKNSTIAKEYMDKLQWANGKQVVALELDVRTRWNSVLTMLKKSLRLKDEICAFTHHLRKTFGKRSLVELNFPLLKRKIGVL